jgi:cell division protein FtsB
MKQALFNQFFENKRRRLVLFGIIITIIIGAVILFSDYGIIKLFNLEYRKSQLDEQIARQNDIRDSLKNEIELMKTDSIEIERVARDKYGLIKSGEEIIIIKKKKEED